MFPLQLGDDLKRGPIEDHASVFVIWECSAALPSVPLPFIQGWSSTREGEREGKGDNLHDVQVCNLSRHRLIVYEGRKMYRLHGTDVWRSNGQAAIEFPG